MMSCSASRGGVPCDERLRHMMSVTLTHHNRYDLLSQAIAAVLDDPHIDEIVVCDDHSTDGSWKRLCRKYRRYPKVHLHRNEQQLDVYANKAQALRHTTGAWSILFDSDNILTPAYIDCLVALAPWNDSHTAYLPTFAEPQFDYRAFEGCTITRRNVRRYLHRPNFTTALNTANYFVHRDTYLAAWDPDATPHTSDSIYMNYLWLAAGGHLYFVPGLRYFHRIHPQSHFMRNSHLTGEFAAQVEQMLRELR